MRKEVVKVDVVESRQVITGTVDKEVWITSDGVRHEDERVAELHEFLWRVDYKNQNPIMQHDNPVTLEFQNEDEARRYHKLYLYDCPLNTDLSTLPYPNKFIVFTEHIGCECKPEYENDTDYCYCRFEDVSTTKIVSIEEYKEMLIKHLESL